MIHSKNTIHITIFWFSLKFGYCLLFRINQKITLQSLLLFRWYQMIHPMSIGSLPRNDTNYSDDSIGECWYKFPFLSHYILYDTIYYIDSIKSVVTVILSDSLELNDAIITNDSFGHNGTLWLRESLLIDDTCRIIWVIPMKMIRI